MKKKKTRKKPKIKAFIIFFLILYLIGVIIYYIVTTPIKNIVIKGNNLLKEKEIIDVIKIDEKTPYFKINTLLLKNKILKNIPLVNNCKVRKNIFGKVTITIEENKILYYDYLEDKLMLSNGKMIEDDNQYLGYPTLVNYVPSDIIKPFIKGLSKIDHNIIMMISEIEYSPDRYNDVIIDSERFVLRMNDGNKVYINTVNIDKLNKYQTIYASLDTGGVLYLDSSSKNYIFKTYAEVSEEDINENELQPSDDGNN